MPDKKSLTSGDALNFDRPLTTVDLAIFSIINDSLCVLLVSRPKTKSEPFPGKQALPGGFLNLEVDATLEDCAKRKLEEKTGVTLPYLEQVGSWGNATRDPRGWSATHVYFALIASSTINQLDDRSEWMELQKLQNDTSLLAFDHHSLLQHSVERLRSKVEYTSLPAFLLEEPFTLPQLQRTYEVVLDRSLDKSSFRTRTLAAGYLQETGLIKTTAPRPTMGYTIKNRDTPIFFPRPFNRK